MAGGFAVPKEPATDMFARRFNAEGFAVLAFDYRHLGESGGHPRLVLTVDEALADWQAAIDYAQTLPDVDADRIAAWGFSASGGHIFPVAARNPHLAAAIAQTPLVDAPAAMPHIARHSTPMAQMRLLRRAALDALGSIVGRDPLLVPLAGPRGTVALLSTPDALDGARALQADRYPQWTQKVAARSVLRLGSYRPGRAAAQVRCPMQVVVCGEDRAAPARLAERAAERAPRAELVQLPGGHYAPFMDAHAMAVDAELAFLTRHLLERPGARPRDGGSSRLRAGAACSGAHEPVDRTR
jgi:dienelactone hydrolase